MISKLQHLDKFNFVLSAHHTGTWFAIRFLNHHPTSVYGTPGFLKLKPRTLKERQTTHAHFASDNILELAFKYKCLIPIRDPALSILTARKRKPNTSAIFVLNEFNRAIRAENEKVIYLPVDLVRPIECKIINLHNIEQHFDLKQDKEYVRTYAEQWKPANSRGTYEEKSQYLEGNLEYVQSKYPQEFKTLAQRTPIFRQFLERLGYKNLPWF